MRYKRYTARREQGVVCFTFILSMIITTNILSSMDQFQPESYTQKDPEKDPVDPDQDDSVWARDSNSGRLVLRYFGQGHQGYKRSLMEQEEVTYDSGHVDADRQEIGGEDGVGTASPVPTEEESQKVNAIYDPRHTMNSSDRWKHCLTIKSNGRLGNQLFAYAALVGIAKRNYMIPCIHKDHALWNIFTLKVANVSSVSGNLGVQYEEMAAYIYQEETTRLNYSLDIELHGYFHSWKYFEEVKPLIREEFTFKESVVSTAKQFLQMVLHKVASFSNNKTVVPIGVHIRLGDMQDYVNVERGYTVVSLDYIDTAMSYFLAIYGADSLVFIVCSDDIQYTRGKLTGLQITSQVPTFYADDTAFLLELAEYSRIPHIHEAEVQLCLLSRCRHNIISTGSFSWWSGWLSNGTVVYYKNFPKPYSELDREFESQDYFPPKWIGFKM